MLRTSSLLLCFNAAATFLVVAPRSTLVECRQGTGNIRCSVTDEDESEEERRKRLESLGRQAAEEAAFLDSTTDDGGLMAEFNARLDQEGGANLLKLKTGVGQVGETAKEGADRAKAASEDLIDAAGAATRGLTEQQKNIGKIVLGLIAFQIVIGLIGSIFGGGSQSYSV